MPDMNRRQFIARSTGAAAFGSIAASTLHPHFMPPATALDLHIDTATKEMPEMDFDIRTIPDFCSHEHWGSINSIGPAPEQNGFRADTTAGARPTRDTSVWDLLLDPYAGGWMFAAGRNPHAAARTAGAASLEEWWNSNPEAALTSFQESAAPLLLTGVFQCTRRGIAHLYGIDLARFDLEEWQQVDKEVRTRYADLFAWYRTAMAQAHFSELIRPVHPEFYVQYDTEAEKAEELAFTSTILRIDPLMALWQAESPRRDALAQITGIDPVDAATWREFITALLDLAAENHTTGIKQLQAYSRSLRYEPVGDREVTFRGDLSQDGIVVFQDWVMHECCKQAHERNWPHQVHVGTHNLGDSNPMPLEDLSQRYPNMDIVMLHCWPYLREAGWLAKHRPNIYIDTCWMPVLNPAFLREALTMWINYVPAHKIMLAHDSTSVEMATGSSLFTREILAEALTSQQQALQLPSAVLHTVAADMLQNNAVRVYGIGEQFKV